MNLWVKFSPRGGVSRKRCIIYEVRSVRKLLTVGVYYHFLLVLPVLTALKLPREPVSGLLGSRPPLRINALGRRISNNNSVKLRVLGGGISFFLIVHILLFSVSKVVVCNRQNVS
jgi:hypothetical protein